MKNAHQHQHFERVAAFYVKKDREYTSLSIISYIKSKKKVSVHQALVFLYTSPPVRITDGVNSLETLCPSLSSSTSYF